MAICLGSGTCSIIKLKSESKFFLGPSRISSAQPALPEAYKTGKVEYLEEELNTLMKEYKENLENDGVVVDVPSPTPDASWLDEKKLES